MSLQVSRVTPPVPAETSAVQPRPNTEHPELSAQPHLKPAEAVEGVRLDTLPSQPPPDVLEEVAAAERRYEEMRAQQRELHFTHDDVANRVVVEVRDLDGNVLRTVPPSKALEIISGGPWK